LDTSNASGCPQYINDVEDSNTIYALFRAVGGIVSDIGFFESDSDRQDFLDNENLDAVSTGFLYAPEDGTDKYVRFDDSGKKENEVLEPNAGTDMPTTGDTYTAKDGDGNQCDISVSNENAVSAETTDVLGQSNEVVQGDSASFVAFGFAPLLAAILALVL